jgi:peptidoglycan/LPS O-acetylase OafA/YrhL
MNTTVSLVASIDAKPQNKSSSSKRVLGSISFLRCIAAFGVVHYHSGRYLFELGFLLIFFSLTVALTATPQDWQSFTMSRARRLLAPWLFWCIVYGAVNCSVYIAQGKPFMDAFEPVMVLYGTAPHLWYLPYAFAVSLGAAIAFKYCNNINVWFTATLVSLFACLIVGSHIDLWVVDAWNLAIPAVLFGLMLASVNQKKVFDSKYIYRILAVVMVSLVLFLITREKIPISMFVASIFLGVAYMIRVESAPWLEYLSGLTFGVYLTHSLFLKLVWGLNLGFNSLINAMLATTAAALLTALLQVTPLRRFV